MLGKAVPTCSAIRLGLPPRLSAILLRHGSHFKKGLPGILVCESEPAHPFPPFNKKGQFGIIVKAAAHQDKVGSA